MRAEADIAELSKITYKQKGKPTKKKDKEIIIFKICKIIVLEQPGHQVPEQDTAPPHDFSIPTPPSRD